MRRTNLRRRHRSGGAPQRLGCCPRRVHREALPTAPPRPQGRRRREAREGHRAPLAVPHSRPSRTACGTLALGPREAASAVRRRIGDEDEREPSGSGPGCSAAGPAVRQRAQATQRPWAALPRLLTQGWGGGGGGPWKGSLARSAQAPQDRQETGPCVTCLPWGEFAMGGVTLLKKHETGPRPMPRYRRPLPPPKARHEGAA